MTYQTPNWHSHVQGIFGRTHYNYYSYLVHLHLLAIKDGGAMDINASDLGETL
jgi:hypothetical protein